MQTGKIKKSLFFILLSALFFAGADAMGQNTDALGTYTPYSLYGIGNIEKQGKRYHYIKYCPRNRKYCRRRGQR